jgi:hypothetical protein
MVCYQILTRFVFFHHKSVLVSTAVKKQKAPAFLVLSGLPFGSPCKHRQWFATEKEAAQFVSHLQKVYVKRAAPRPAGLGGQLELFQEVSR